MNIASSYRNPLPTQSRNINFIILTMRPTEMCCSGSE